MKWFFFVLLLVLLSACNSPSKDVVDLSGTQGVVIKPYVEDLNVYAGEVFSLDFELSNQGSVDIDESNPGRFYVSYDPWYLELNGWHSKYPDNFFWLEGRKPYVDGERTFITLDFTAHKLEQFSEEISTKVLFSVCYPYTSLITSDVCIESDRLATEGAIACKNKPLTPKTPGAPVIVERVEVRNMREVTGDDGFGVVRPFFRISLRNAGDGLPSILDCGSDAPSDEDVYNVVFLRAFLLDQELECSDHSPVFFDDKAVVLCNLPDDSSVDFVLNTGNFQSLLTVELNYFYRETVSYDVVVSR